MEMTRIMSVGNATLDIINHVATYPAEDSEVRASAQSRRVGGNAANTAIVLAQLGVESVWVGNLAESSGFVEEELTRYGVDVSLATRVPHADVPTSYILLSEQNGSRSIVHCRDMPEYRADDFADIDLQDLDWIHFEGRAVDQLVAMLRRARRLCGLPLSLEIEKPRDGIEDLFDDVDLLLFSRDYVLAAGFADAAGLLGSLPKGLVATCTWGAQGAWAIDQAGCLLHVAPALQRAVVDTIGAGDVFNAAMVHALSTGATLERALHAAVELASTQCTREGLDLHRSTDRRM